MRRQKLNEEQIGLLIRKARTKLEEAAEALEVATSLLGQLDDDSGKSWSAELRIAGQAMSSIALIEMQIQRRG